MLHNTSCLKIRYKTYNKQLCKLLRLPINFGSSVYIQPYIWVSMHRFNCITCMVRTCWLGDILFCKLICTCGCLLLVATLNSLTSETATEPMISLYFALSKVAIYHSVWIFKPSLICSFVCQFPFSCDKAQVMNKTASVAYFCWTIAAKRRSSHVLDL